MNDNQLKEAIALSGLSEFEWIKNSMKVIAELKTELTKQPKRVWTYEELEREA